ncbi:hypothetical protein ACRAWG_05315 [Methylobacterium sp. P31]
MSVRLARPRATAGSVVAGREAALARHGRIAPLAPDRDPRL